MSRNMVRRPPSEDLIDLHVFVVPIESWLGKYSVAYNNVALQSTSAGFIRVYPHATLQIVRELIEEQLEDDIVPENYVFLRSVGRCLAVVNQSQEKSLKAKHFLPPVAFSPEIFILPGTHEQIASLRKQTKSIVVNGDIAVEDEYRLKTRDFYERETPEDYPRSEQFSDDGDINANRHALRDQLVHHSNTEESFPSHQKTSNSLDDSNDGEKDPSEMLMEEAYSRKNQHHFSDVIKAKKNSGEKKRSTVNGEMDTKYSKGTGYPERHGYSGANGYSQGPRNVEGIRPSKGSYAHQGRSPKNQMDDTGETQSEMIQRNPKDKRSPKDERSPKVERSPLDERSPRDGRSSKDERSPRGTRSEGEESRKFRERGETSTFAEQSNETRRDRSQTFPRGGPAIQVLHPEIVAHPLTPQGLNRPSPLPSANVIHSTLTMDGFGRASEDKFAKNAVRPENTERNDVPLAEKVEIEVEKDSGISEDEGNEKHKMNDRYSRASNVPPARTPNPEDLKKKEEERKRLEEEKMKMEEMKKNMENDTMQMMKDMEDLLRKKKEEDEKRKEEEERRKREEKERMEQKRKEAAELRDKLIKIREERIKKQKHREGLMKNARELKATVTAKRGPETSLWETKYQAEKQRAVILEEELSILKSELSASQRKLLKSLEQKDVDEQHEQKSPRTIAGPSQLNNLKNEVRKINKDKERVEDDIEKTKRKLLVESQQKAEAQQQLRELRKDKRVKGEKDANTPRTKLSNVEA